MMMFSGFSSIRSFGEIIFCPVPGMYFPCRFGLMSTTNSILVDAETELRNVIAFPPAPQKNVFPVGVKSSRLFQNALRLSNLFRKF